MEYIGPGPINTSLLRLQSNHISNNVWNGEESTFRVRYNFWQHLPSEPVLEVIRNTAFSNILEIERVNINNHLITAMIERWRPETHTFHFPNGECTITLEDVAIQLGIPIDGLAVTGVTSMVWDEVCLELLGAIPTNREITGQMVQLTWLENTFRELPENATQVVIEQHARAFVLRMIGGFLMPNTSGSRVHLMYLPLLEDLSKTFQYSWGSAVLACLYQGLCRAATISEQKDIGGCQLLLQSWAYDHIPILSPRLYDNTLQFFPLVKRWSQRLIMTNIPGHAVNIIRTMLDSLRIDQFVWTPYRNMNISREISNISRARVPLICFAIVEWHPVDRVMRQFGMQQSIPKDPPNFDKLHMTDLRGKNDYNWSQKHNRWIEKWSNWENYVIDGIPDIEPLYHYSEYIQWYLQRTRKYISPQGAYSVGMYNFIRRIRDLTAPPRSHINPIQTLNDVNYACREMLNALAELNPSAFSDNYYQAPPTQHFDIDEYESPQ
ncbi:hypothetical protein Lal_00001290 [Lupinus albus]|nr:hypothetical protein Lal_00001290 [Lupinus albus]